MIKLEFHLPQGGVWVPGGLRCVTVQRGVGLGSLGCHLSLASTETSFGYSARADQSSINFLSAWNKISWGRLPLWVLSMIFFSFSLWHQFLYLLVLAAIIVITPMVCKKKYSLLMALCRSSVLLQAVGPFCSTQLNTLSCLWCSWAQRKHSVVPVFCCGSKYSIGPF